MKISSRLWRAGAVALIVIVAGCGDVTRAESGPVRREVGVVTVAPRPLAVTTELPGRVEPSRVAEVRARASGIVLERAFREGSEVEQGQVLFRIDPAPLRAIHDSARAILAKAEANLVQAKLRAERYAPLVETHAISRQDYDDAVAAHAVAEADVALARAALQKARLDLDYATVTAPIAGRIGRARVTEGALVGQGEATPLATIQQIDPIYVDLVQSSAEVARLRRRLASGRLEGVDEATVTLLTEDGVEHPHPGKLLFTDITVDESTGALVLRAEVPNPDGTLLPGMYVRARLQQGVLEDAILVPQAAVLRDGAGASVRVVAPDDTVAVRPIEVGAAEGDEWVVLGGLVAGDRVIVDGLQKVRPGSPVTPVPWTPLDAEASADASTGPR